MCPPGNSAVDFVDFLLHVVCAASCEQAVSEMVAMGVKVFCLLL